jgi:hypothetical protein
VWEGVAFIRIGDQWLLWTFGFLEMLEISSVVSQEGLDSVESQLLVILPPLPGNPSAPCCEASQPQKGRGPQARVLHF